MSTSKPIDKTQQEHPMKQARATTVFYIRRALARGMALVAAAPSLGRDQAGVPNSVFGSISSLFDVSSNERYIKSDVES